MDAALDAIKDWMQRGGWVMWPLLCCAFATLFISFSKAMQWGFFLWCRWRGASQWHQVLAGETVQGKSPSPYLQIYVRAKAETALPLNEALAVEAQRVVRRLERGLGVLDTIVTMAPMLGILGTVTGIIASFNLLGATTSADPSAVSSGIAEALITTATGLVVSLVALLPLNAGRLYHTRLVTEMEVELTKLEHTLSPRVV
jgi:biopolymer transport protein ExbB